MTALQPAVDRDGNTLWLHSTCGYTLWSDDRPEWCVTCSYRTDAWRLVHVEDDQPCPRDRAPMLPDYPELAEGLKRVFGDQEIRTMLAKVGPLADDGDNWRLWNQLRVSMTQASGESIVNH